MSVTSNQLSSTITSPYFIHYAVEVLNTTEHLFQICMHAKIPTQTEVIIKLPAWIPGSYMIRDFARNLHQLHCVDGKLTITRLDKQTWSLNQKDGSAINEFKLVYQVYAYDLSVRSAYINDQYAFYNGTSVYLSIAQCESIPHIVSLDDTIFGNSKQDIASSLLLQQVNAPVLEGDSTKDDAPVRFMCNDYYELIDHPVLMGHFNQHTFALDNYRFHIVFTGQHCFDMQLIEQDLIPIIRHHLSLFGELPCKEYWFITLVCDQGFGGLEHIASTVLQYSRFDLPMLSSAHSISDRASNNTSIKPLAKGYQQFLSLCSHELFHTWHVKQIKPQVMMKPDLSCEVYTEQMWIYEGFTSFYDDVSLARSGIISPQEYVQILNENITRLLKNAGRHKQSVAESSFEAWSKFYKQDAGSINHIVSYYNKGAIVALCLDISLRIQSNNKFNLDNLMKKLWLDFGKTKIGTPDDVIGSLCKKYFNIDIDSFIHTATQTTEDLPLLELLSAIGLQFKLRPSKGMQDKGGETNKVFSQFDLGAHLTDKGNELKVVSVFANRAASNAGLQVDDTIVALNHWQCNEQRFYSILSQCDLGTHVPIHVIRDGRLLALDFVSTPAINDTCDIQIYDSALYEKWLGLS